MHLNINYSILQLPDFSISFFQFLDAAGQMPDGTFLSRQC